MACIHLISGRTHMTLRRYDKGLLDQYFELHSQHALTFVRGFIIAMAEQPSPAAVGTLYDQFSDLCTDIFGGCIHFGYFDNPAERLAIGAATDRLTSLVAERLSLGPGQRILDVGCGTGKPAAQIASAAGARVLGISISNRQIELAQAQYGTTRQPGQVCFQFANAMDMPFADGSFDGAYAIESLFHMDDKATALAHIGHTLRPGGRLVIADFFLDEPLAGSDADILTQFCQLCQAPPLCTAREYRDLLQQAGFEVIEFTDIRNNVQRNYEVMAAALRQKALLLDEASGEQLRGGASIVEQMVVTKTVGYVLMTATRMQHEEGKTMVH